MLVMPVSHRSVYGSHMSSANAVAALMAHHSQHKKRTKKEFFFFVCVCIYMLWIFFFYWNCQHISFTSPISYKSFQATLK